MMLCTSKQVTQSNDCADMILFAKFKGLKLNILLTYGQERSRRP